jgi:hypothetical protein
MNLTSITSAQLLLQAKIQKFRIDYLLPSFIHSSRNPRDNDLEKLSCAESVTILELILFF